jgi:hypothetical protein
MTLARMVIAIGMVAVMATVCVRVIRGGGGVMVMVMALVIVRIYSG